MTIRHVTQNVKQLSTLDNIKSLNRYQNEKEKSRQVTLIQKEHPRI